LAPTDNELVVRCLQRDEVAWQLLVERHSRRVLNIAYQFTGRRDEAEELAQEVFLRVFRSLHQFDLTTHFVPWLVRVSRNLCIDEHRSRAREKAALVADEVDPERTEDTGASPYRNLEEKELEQRVRRGLAELGEELRTALVLRDLQGLSYSEIAEVLHLAVGTVKSRIHRGRLELATVLCKSRDLNKAGWMEPGETAEEPES
jgi:RNA polymerase sigma-70 factor (ECF subfamily)